MKLLRIGILALLGLLVLGGLVNSPASLVEGPLLLNHSKRPTKPNLFAAKQKPAAKRTPART